MQWTKASTPMQQINGDLKIAILQHKIDQDTTVWTCLILSILLRGEIYWFCTISITKKDLRARHNGVKPIQPTFITLQPKGFFFHAVRRSPYIPSNINTEYFLNVGAAVLLAVLTHCANHNKFQVDPLPVRQTTEVQMLNYLQIQMTEFLILVCLDTS